MIRGLTNRMAADGGWTWRLPGARGGGHMSDSRVYSQFEPPFGTAQEGATTVEQTHQADDRPYAVIRRYTGLDPHAVDEVARRVNEGLVPVISQLPGFVAYCALHTGGDVVAS